MISISAALLQLLEKKAKYFRSIAQISCRPGTRLDRSARGGDRQSLLALVADDIEWIIPGKDWPLARQ
jgi:ketosteroid isomerase-like protein